MIEFDDGSGSVLRIQPLRTPRDEAIYECVASNTVGEISVSTKLVVLRGKCLLNLVYPFLQLGKKCVLKIGTSSVTELKFEKLDLYVIGKLMCCVLFSL